MPVVLIGPSSFAAIVGGCGAVNLFHFDFVQRLQFNIMTIFFEDENDADCLFFWAQFFLPVKFNFISSHNGTQTRTNLVTKEIILMESKL